MLFTWLIYWKTRFRRCQPHESAVYNQVCFGFADSFDYLCSHQSCFLAILNRLLICVEEVGNRRQFFLAIMEAENTGRFIKYDPVTKETTVLIKNLLFPNGVAVSKDGTFIILAESRTGRFATSPSTRIDVCPSTNTDSREVLWNLTLLSWPLDIVHLRVQHCR